MIEWLLVAAGAYALGKGEEGVPIYHRKGENRLSKEAFDSMYDDIVTIDGKRIVTEITSDGTPVIRADVTARELNLIAVQVDNAMAGYKEPHTAQDQEQMRLLLLLKTTAMSYVAAVQGYMNGSNQF